MNRRLTLYSTLLPTKDYPRIFGRPPLIRMRPPPRLKEIERDVVGCRACPRLVAWRERVAIEKRAAYRDETYWGKPVPGFGDPDARLVIVGLAPAAHGANRTGRMFTGDRSGDWLYAALHRFGFASQPHATSRDDGLRLVGAYVTAAVRCAPPGNRPRPDERARCRPFLERELDHFLPRLRCVVALGQYAFDHVLRVLRDRGAPVPSPKPAFGHGATVPLGPGLELLASYHPSQQNTFTGTLTRDAFDEIWAHARDLVR
jgi:uracil-DNA glycosylase